ncbi:hypothetical protein RRG08_055063 [Elysia crispata]|uniref:Uncharacterized protein n=1 Tax=Elysia crispata TaxID=231223 RepID=A0AAE1B1W1_9GAST|nr:hypothetical protein RRG08_055063 [Elysia crispata]
MSSPCSSLGWTRLDQAQRGDQCPGAMSPWAMVWLHHPLCVQAYLDNYIKDLFSPVTFQITHDSHHSPLPGYRTLRIGVQSLGRLVK